MSYCDECRRLLVHQPGDPLVTHLMINHDLTLREAELHAEVLIAGTFQTGTGSRSR